MFDQMKSILDMKRKMNEIKHILDSTFFDVESSDRKIKITMNGSQEVRDIKFNGNSTTDDLSALEIKIKETFNRAIKRSREIAAEKMKRMTGLSLPGM